MPALATLSAPNKQTALFAPCRLIELSGQTLHQATARRSLACWALAMAQQRGEPTAWVESQQHGGVFPPDIARCGIDLAALTFVRVPGSGKKVVFDQLRCAEWLLRSGAFGLMVVDFLGDEPQQNAGWLGRWVALARQQACTVVLLSEKPAECDSLGALVGLRVQPTRQDATGTLHLEPVKHKAAPWCPPPLPRFCGPPGWVHGEMRAQA